MTLLLLHRDCAWCGLETVTDTPWGPIPTDGHDLCEAEFLASLPENDEVTV